MKKLITLILIILVFSCTKINENKIIGTWELQSVESEAQEDATCFVYYCEGQEITFTEDEIISTIYSSDYSIDNNKLFFVGVDYKITFIGKKLIMKSDYNKAVLKR